MKCIICGKDYAAKRATSKYCSAKCRQVSYRNANVTESVSVTPEPVTLIPTIEATHEYLEAGTAPRPIDQEVQAIWDRRNGQRQPAAYKAPHVEEWDFPIVFEKEGVLS